MSNEPIVPVNDLSRAITQQRTAIDQAVAEVLDSGWLVLGPQVEAFEAELSAYLGVAHTVTVASGTDALIIGLLTLGCGPGDLVATVANAGAYASTAIRAIGAVPVYVDVDEATALMTPETLAPALDLGVTTVVVTHLYGLMADVSPLVEQCHGRGVTVLEDCAQALGASAQGGRAGSFADLAAFSFYPTKNLGALGDGGAVATADADLARKARMLRQYGWASKYRIDLSGGRNSRLDELQAAVLRVRLPLLDGQNAARRAIHARYVTAARSGTFFGSAGVSFTAHLAVLQVERRDEVRSRFLAAGVATDVHYPVPDHQQAVKADYRSASPLSVSERMATTVVTVPCFPELSEAEVGRVCDQLAAS